MCRNSKPNWHSPLLKIFPLCCVKDYPFSVCDKSATASKSVCMYFTSFFLFPSYQTVLCWPGFKQAGTLLCFFLHIVGDAESPICSVFYLYVIMRREDTEQYKATHIAHF